jgi:AAA domain/UvrD-like helicase C-terminal domain
VKQSEIKVGGHYVAKVSGKITTVRVDNIRKVEGFTASPLSGMRSRSDTTVYEVTNIRTGRRLSFHSAAKFRAPVKPVVQLKQVIQEYIHPSPILGRPSNPLADAVKQTRPETPLSRDEAEEIGVLSQAEGEHSSDPITPVEGVTEVVSLPDKVAQPLSVPGVMEVVSEGSNGLAAKIAAMQRVVGSRVAGMLPNQEQEAIIAAASQPGLKVMVVAAGAGTGKTATLKMLEQVLPGRGQYTAFNTSLVTESKGKFKKAACNTTHSLAFRAVGRAFQHRLGGERVKSYEVAKMLGINSMQVVRKGAGEPDAEGKSTDKIKTLHADFLAGLVTAAVRKFCQSADRTITAEHLKYIDGIDTPTPEGKRTRTNNDLVLDYLLPFCTRAWTDLSDVNGTLPYQHDYYVKSWQLGEGDDRPIIAADYILLDEAQDTAPVFLSILQQQEHALLVLVGDDCQQIYEWRGAYNAMRAFPGAPRKLLSQSYRFGQAVADTANAVLATLEEPTDLVMRGDPSIPSRVAAVDQPRCYLYRTNAGAVGRVMVEMEAGRKPHLIGGGDDVVRWMQAVMDLQAKRGTRHPELCCFDSWKEVQEYSKTDDGSDMRLMVKLVELFGAKKIHDALCDMTKEDEADVVVSTTHKSKGREWDTVKLGPDFPLANKMRDSDRKLLYVALTRAKLVLDVTECPPLCGGYGRGGASTEDDADTDEGGRSWVPGIHVVYTKPQPTVEEQSAYLVSRDAPTANGADTAGTHMSNGSSTTTTARLPMDKATARAVTVGKYTWAKYESRFVVRGPVDTALGSRVTVERRDGSTSEVHLRSVVYRYDDAWLYGT